MIFFIIVLMGLLGIEYKYYKTCITPFFIIGVIYLISVPVINVLGSRVGYNSITLQTIYMFLLFLLVIFIGDLFFKLKLRGSKKGKVSVADIYIKRQKVIWYVFVFMLAGYILSFLQAMQRYGISDIKGKSSGVFGHMGIFCIAISPLIVLLYINTKKIKYLLSLCLLYILMVIFGGKTYIFISLVSGTLLILDQKKVKFREILKIGILLAVIAIIIFLSIYTVIPILRSGNFAWKNIKDSVVESLQHVFYYFSAPFLCSNTYFCMPGAEGLEQGLRVLFAPFVSIYEAFLGSQNYPDIIMSEWATIAKEAHRTTSNVGGLFSEAVYRVGLPGALIYVFGISGYVSFMYYLKRKGNYYHGSAALAIALIGLCFFCNYFTLLVVLEMIVYLFLMELVILILDKKKIVIKDWRIKQKCRLIRY